MTFKEFAELVCKMRTAQKAYFRTHSFSDLDESEKLEHEVDNALREISEPKNQLSLFSAPTSS